METTESEFYEILWQQDKRTPETWRDLRGKVKYANGSPASERLRGALVGNLQKILSHLDVHVEGGGYEARHLFLASLIGGDGSTKAVTDQQARALNAELTIRQGDEWVVNHENADRIRALTIALIKCGIYPPIEFKEVSKMETPQTAPKPQSGDGKAKMDYKHAEAPLSATAKFRDNVGAEWLITLRQGVTGAAMLEFLENVGKASEWLAGHGYIPVDSGSPKPSGKTVQHNAGLQPQAPTPSNNATASGSSFPAETLAGNVMNGKVYWAIQGGPFQQYGVRVWPEVLRSVGLDPDALDPAETYDLSGYVAHYEENDKGHKKVTALIQA